MGDRYGRSVMSWAGRVTSSAPKIVPSVSMTIGPLGHSNTLILGSEDGQMREQVEQSLLAHLLRSCRCRLVVQHGFVYSTNVSGGLQQSNQSASAHTDFES